MPAGRPLKIGLDYFPFDTTMEDDDKIELLEAKFPDHGWKVWTKLLIRIYRYKGYFFEASEENIILFSRRINVDINYINEVINFCVTRDLFNSRIYHKFGILTSKRIQLTYLHITQRRHIVDLIEEFLCITAKEGENINPKVEILIYSDINRIFANGKVISDYRKYRSTVISFSLLLLEESNSDNNSDTRSLNKVREDKNAGKIKGQNSEAAQPPGAIMPPLPSEPVKTYPLHIPVSRAMREPGKFDWELEKTIFQQETQWIYKFAESYGKTEADIREWFPAFFARLEKTNDMKSADLMFKHFANWYPRRMEAMEREVKADVRNAAKRNTDNKDYDDKW